MKSIILFLVALVTSSLMGQGLPPGTQVLRDVSYVENGHEKQKLDLYLPEEGDAPRPLLIWIHGGGWQGGSKNGCPFLRQGFLQRGYAIASLDYRLTDAAPFPAQIEDCKAAIRWLRAHATEHGLNPDAFGVGGSSAGGHLVALVGSSGDSGDFDVGDHLEVSSRVQAVYDLYGPTDILVFVQTPGYESHAQAGSPEGKLLGGAPLERKAEAESANPITYVSEDDPPYLIVHGDADGTVPLNQSELMHAALVEAGVPSRFITIKGGGHGGGFPNEELTKIATQFFDRHVKGQTDGEEWPVAMTSELAAIESGTGRQRPKVGFQMVLKREDANGDGKVTRSEFKGPQAIFKRFDSDRNGVLTESDFR